jgi:hypothetical protein
MNSRTSLAAAGRIGGGLKVNALFLNQPVQKMKYRLK